MDPKIVIEGEIKFRGTRKWRPRWAIVSRLSPVADCLHLQLYRDEKERIKSGLTKASLSLEKYIGLETGFTFDKESNTLALICQDMVLLLAFNSRETLLHWQTTIRSHLPQEHQYPVEIVSFPAKSRLTVGPSRLHIRDGCFALVSGNPPRLAGLWSLPDLRRYGVLNGKFCFEGGSSCGKGEGLHVLSTIKTGELMKAFQLASIGNLQPKRKLSIKQDKCNNLSDRISFCSSSSHSSGTSSISSGNGSYQSSLEYSTPRSARHLHHTHHPHHHHHGSIGNERVPSGCCSSAVGSAELWYDKLKMLRSANSGLLTLQDGNSSICSCLSEYNLLTPTSDNIGSKSTLNGHFLYPSEFDAESTSSSTNTLKQTTFNSSRQAESVDPKLLQKLITGHYQIPKHFLTQCQGIKNDVDDKVMLNNLEMYDVPRKFQQIHFNGSSNRANDNGKVSQPNCDQNLNTLNELGKDLKDKGLTIKSTNSLDKSTCSGQCNNGLNCDSTNQKDSISFGSDKLCKECNFLVKPIVESNKVTKLNGICKGLNEEQKAELKRQLNESEVNLNCAHSTSSPEANLINKSILNDDKMVNKESVNSSHKSDNLTDNLLINNNYVNIDFVRSLQFYQNVGLLKKQMVNLVNPKPAVSLPDEPDKSKRLIDGEDPLVGEVNYNLMVNKSSGNKDKDDDYLEMVPLIGESELNECEEQIYLVNQKQLNDNLLSLLTILNSSKKINETNQSICASSSSPSPSTSSSSTNGNQSKFEANKSVNPLSRSLSDFTRKLKLLHEKSRQGKDKGSPNEPPYKDQTSTSCPPSPVKLSAKVNLDLSLPVPPPPPPPPLSYLYACRLNRSMESLVYPFTHQSSLPFHLNTPHQFYPSDGDQFDSIDHHHCQCNYDHLTSSDEDIYHASQIRVTSNSPFTCRPMSPSEIKRSISLPNGGSSVHRPNKLNCYPIVINNGQPLPDQCNQDNSQSNCHSENVNTVNLLKLNHSNGINSSCLNDLNKSNVNHVNSLGKSMPGKSSTAITVKPRSSNEYVTLDVDRKS